MIQPVHGVRLVSVPRAMFPASLWGMVVWRTITGRLRWVLIDHERTLQKLSWWCRRWGLMPIIIRERAEGYDFLVNGQPQSLTEVFPEAHVAGVDLR